MDRAPARYLGGHRFESCRRRLAHSVSHACGTLIISSSHLFYRALNLPSFILPSYTYTVQYDLDIADPNSMQDRTRVKYEPSIWPRFPRVLRSLEDRAPARCLRGHRFESCRGLRFFLCPFRSQPSVVIARVLNKNVVLWQSRNNRKLQSTNSAKTLKMFNLYSGLGL